MNSKCGYKQNIINNYCKKYNVTKEELLTSDIHYFRYTCLKYNDFIKHIPIPKIPIKSHYEAVLIEFREFPHLEFLIRNAILKLGDAWAFTIICGNINYKFMFEMCNRISTNINIIKVNIDNMLPYQYNKFLTSKSFWDTLEGEKILIYQEDSMIFKKLDDRFLQYDYIGAPFPKYQNDTPNCVGNGGLSLRSKTIMIKIISSISVKKTVFNSSTLDYMNSQNLSFPPEDVYFSKNAQEYGIGVVADYDTASLFSSEAIYNENSFGGHKFWISNNNWKNEIKKTFTFSNYIPNNDIGYYLSYVNLNETHNKTRVISNAFDIDLNFCNNVNNLNMKNNLDIIKYIQLIGMDGFIYHPKQLFNIYPNMKIYTFMNNLFCMYKNNIHLVSTFVKETLYQNTFDKITKNLIKNYFYNLNAEITLLIVVFIGNEDRGVDLINKLIFYKQIQQFNVSFCFNLNSNLCEKFKGKIKDNFQYYAIYETKEFGTDITPTLLMYNEILKRDKFKHIIKLQTKTILKQYTELTNFLLTNNLEKILSFKNTTCNCIGHPNYYIPLDEDPFNNELKLRYVNEINITFRFVGGTIFYSPEIFFNKTLQFMKNNFKSYLFNNLYENNSINMHNSPIHFLERVFGSIKC